MPVRPRRNRRTLRAEFPVGPALAAAFRAYIDSDPPAGSWSEWREHWKLHDLLDEAGALQLPFIPPCCFHPGVAGVRWEYAPDAVAIYRRLAAAL